MMLFPQAKRWGVLLLGHEPLLGLIRKGFFLEHSSKTFNKMLGLCQVFNGEPHRISGFSTVYAMLKWYYFPSSYLPIYYVHDGKKCNFLIIHLAALIFHSPIF
jgi:hypothetical protein